MAVSGKCYLSLDNQGRSANRGECMQQCRRSYTVRDKETGVELDIDNEYIMSPKDLKTIGFIDKMMKAGVSVFKIEGAPVRPNTSTPWCNATKKPFAPCRKAPSTRARQGVG